MAHPTSEVKETLKALMRESMPELNGFQWPLRAKVVKLHEAGGTVGEFSKKYSIDVQPLKPDGSVDEEKPVIPDVPIDITWAGAGRALMGLPPIGATVRVEFYYWDASQPYVSGILADGYNIPDHPLGSFIVQQKDGVFIKINPGGDVEITTDKNIKLQAGKAQMTFDKSGAIEVGPGMMSISAAGNIALSGGGPAVARVGDSVECPCGTGRITGGSSKVDCGG